MYETFEYNVTGGIGLVRLNRPKKLNAINPEMVAELRDLVNAVRADKSVRVLIFTGNGRAFSAGADISRIVEIDSVGAYMDLIETIQTVYNAIEDLDRPTIGALNGLAFGGGCELALACDLRVMAEDAKIGVPEILIGALPGAGGTQRLSHMLPPAIAKRMIYMGEPLSAQTAAQFGLVNEVVPGARVLDVAMEWARKLASLSPLALRCASLLVHIGQDADLKTGIEAERQAVSFLFCTEDRDEGMRAFLEKRPATFKGR